LSGITASEQNIVCQQIILKINPHAIVVPILVIVDPTQCGDMYDFDIANLEKYNYFIDASHSAKGRRNILQPISSSMQNEKSMLVYLR
jgi:hypothetical protein